jgi:hypothetical protein
MNILHYFLIYTAQGSTAPDQGGFYNKVPLLSTLTVPELNQFVWTRRELYRLVYRFPRHPEHSARVQQFFHPFPKKVFSLLPINIHTGP